MPIGFHFSLCSRFAALGLGQGRELKKNGSLSFLQIWSVPLVVCYTAKYGWALGMKRVQSLHWIVPRKEGGGNLGPAWPWILQIRSLHVLTSMSFCTNVRHWFDVPEMELYCEDVIHLMCHLKLYKKNNPDKMLQKMYWSCLFVGH